MLKVHALEFFSMGERSSAIRSDVYFTFRKVPDYQKIEVKEAIAALANLCERIGLPTSQILLKGRKDNIPETKREWELLVDTVRAELESNLFLFVPQHRCRYYEMDMLASVKMAFPMASKELVAAGNAMAVGLYTASVFHAMRAAEIGVRVLGKELGVSFPDKPLELAEWHSILDQADSRIAAKKALPRGTHKDEELNFYSQAATQFRYFKDGWRVRVAHARETYDEAPALTLFNHTIEFFETLAFRLKE